MPDFKTIADFRKDNKQAIRRVCVEFVGLCRELNLFSATLVAIDGSKFKAVNSRDKNFARKSVKRRLQKTQANIDRYLAKLDTADREAPEIREVTAAELKQKTSSMEAPCAPRQIISLLTDGARGAPYNIYTTLPRSRKTLHPVAKKHKL